MKQIADEAIQAQFRYIEEQVNARNQLQLQLTAARGALLDMSVKLQDAQQDVRVVTEHWRKESTKSVKDLAEAQANATYWRELYEAKVDEIREQKGTLSEEEHERVVDYWYLLYCRELGRRQDAENALCRKEQDKALLA